MRILFLEPTDLVFEELIVHVIHAYDRNDFEPQPVAIFAVAALDGQNRPKL